MPPVIRALPFTLYYGDSQFSRRRSAPAARRDLRRKKRAPDREGTGARGWDEARTSNAAPGPGGK